MRLQGWRVRLSRQNLKDPRQGFSRHTILRPVYKCYSVLQRRQAWQRAHEPVPFNNAPLSPAAEQPGCADMPEPGCQHSITLWHQVGGALLVLPTNELWVDSGPAVHMRGRSNSLEALVSIHEGDPEIPKCPRTKPGCQHTVDHCFDPLEMRCALPTYAGML